MSYTRTRLLIRLIVRALARVTIEGAEHIPPTGGYVAVTNHVGRLDAALPFVLVDREDVIMLVAEKYRKVAVTRWIANGVNGIWVDRFGADMTAVRHALKRLRAGGVLVIAPEGTRSATGCLIPARSGAGFIAAKSGMPVLPTALVGSEDATVKRSLRRLRRAHVTVRFGPCFTIAARPDLSGEDRLAAYDDEVMCRIAALLPASRRGAYADSPRLAELLAAPGAGRN